MSAISDTISRYVPFAPKKPKIDRKQALSVVPMRNPLIGWERKGKEVVLSIPTRDDRFARLFKRLVRNLPDKREIGLGRSRIERVGVVRRRTQYRLDRGVGLEELQAHAQGGGSICHDVPADPDEAGLHRPFVRRRPEHRPPARGEVQRKDIGHAGVRTVPNGSGKAAVGRQSQLPFKRALKISLKSLKIRFWRSMITAGGIFLGIAFFTVVLTQSLMQWPLPEKVRAGFVRVSGEVNGPGDYTSGHPVPVEEGIEAGIPEDVVKLVADEDGTFSLAAIVQGQLDAKRADKNLARVKDEWEGLRKIKDKLAFYMSAVTDADMKVEDAIKFGVPADVVRKLAGKGKSFKGSALADVVRDQPDWIQPLFSAAILDQDINIEDAVRAGVPRAIASTLLVRARLQSGSAERCDQGARRRG